MKEEPVKTKKELMEIETGVNSKKGVKHIKEEKKFYIGNFNGLVDLVRNDERIKFLTYKEGLLDYITIDEKEFEPPEQLPWLSPRYSEVIKEYKKHTVASDSSDGTKGGCLYCNTKLYPELLEYFKQFSETPTEFHYHYLVWTTFHSYLIEKFNFSPILFLVATKDRGKTPTLKALAYIARRGIFTETFREPNIIRWSSDYEASLFFDVRNFPLKVEKSGSEDLIFGRAERGSISSRVIYPERGAFKDMVNFSVFGLTGATSNIMVDSITEARCIVVRMPFSKKVFNIEPTREIGLPYKEKLTAFRMAHFDTPFIYLEKEKIGKLENYLRGYHQMIKTLFPIYEKEFVKFRNMIRNQKKDEAESTLEGKLIKSVISLQDNVEQGINFLATEDIANEINKERVERFWYGIDKIGSELSSLGFKMIRNSLRTKRGIEYDPILVESLADQYGVDHERHTSDKPSEESEESKDMPEIAKDIFGNQ